MGEESGGLLPARTPGWVSTERCAAVGTRLAGLELRQRGFGVLPANQPAMPLHRLLDYQFFLSALLFDFRGFDIELDGKLLHGADAFMALAGRRAVLDPDFFSARRMQQVTGADVQVLFSASGRLQDCRMRRCDERAALWRDAAERLLREYRGEAAVLLDSTGGMLRRPAGDGLLDVLDRFAGYHDPHFKKGFMLVKSLEGLGLWRAQDRQNLFIPVDYHLMRVAFRSGMVEVAPSVAQMLRERRPAHQDLDDALRELVKRAYKQVEASAGLDIFSLDELFWTLGRSCCHHGRPPRCAACDFSECSVMRSFDMACPGRCPLSGVCRGSLEPAYAALYETEILTVYY